MKALFYLLLIIPFSLTNAQNDWKESVLMTMVGGEKIYEITIRNHSYEIKVYDISNGIKNRKFVERFSSTSDLVKTEPYKSLLPLQNGRMFITEGKVKNIHYKLYDEQEIIEIYTFSNGVEKLYKTVLKSDMGNYPEFLKLVLRD